MQEIGHRKRENVEISKIEEKILKPLSMRLINQLSMLKGMVSHDLFRQ